MSHDHNGPPNAYEQLAVLRHTLTQMTEALRQAEAERDEARAEIERLRALTVWGTAHPVGPRYDEVETLRALLREVEWHGGSGTIEVPCCPLCYGHGEGPFKGHTPDCRLAAALEGR